MKNALRKRKCQIHLQWFHTTTYVHLRIFCKMLSQNDRKIVQNELNQSLFNCIESSSTEEKWKECVLFGIVCEFDWMIGRKRARFTT